MTDRLPPNLLALFQPRPALRYLPPNDFAPEDRKTSKVDGVAAFLPILKKKIEDEKDIPWIESGLEKRDREKLEMQMKQKKLIEQAPKLFKPREDPNIKGDAYKTLFIGRLHYDVTSKEIEHEFEKFGLIDRVRIVKDRSGVPGKDGKPRGYAFVVFEREQDVKAAYKASEFVSFRGRRVVVDVERGRTVKDWLPRRYGGGIGGRHYTKIPARQFGGFGPPPGPGFGRGGGFRGGSFDRGSGFRGGRGGFRGGGGGGGGGYGGRSGVGYQNGGPPNGAPAGPRQGDYRSGRSGGGYGGYGGDRDRNNANFEPLPPRGGGRDYDRPPKRPYDDHDADRPPKRRY